MWWTTISRTSSMWCSRWLTRTSVICSSSLTRTIMLRGTSSGDRSFSNYLELDTKLRWSFSSRVPNFCHADYKHRYIKAWWTASRMKRCKLRSRSINRFIETERALVEERSGSTNSDSSIDRSLSMMTILQDSAVSLKVVAQTMQVENAKKLSAYSRHSSEYSLLEVNMHLLDNMNFLSPSNYQTNCRQAFSSSMKEARIIKLSIQ